MDFTHEGVLETRFADSPGSGFQVCSLFLFRSVTDESSKMIFLDLSFFLRLIAEHEVLLVLPPTPRVSCTDYFGGSFGSFQAV
jgi:hypothetical protein